MYNFRDFEGLAGLVMTLLSLLMPILNFNMKKSDIPIYKILNH